MRSLTSLVILMRRVAASEYFPWLFRISALSKAQRSASTMFLQIKSKLQTMKSATDTFLSQDKDRRWDKKKRGTPSIFCSLVNNLCAFQSNDSTSIQHVQCSVCSQSTIEIFSPSPLLHHISRSHQSCSFWIQFSSFQCDMNEKPQNLFLSSFVFGSK